MKFSESWLREWVNPDLDTQSLVDQVTMAGLEVDAVDPVAGEFSGVVVGEIISTEQHPDADKLRVCKVAGSPDGEQQVVCGAPNARPGIKIPFALVGAKLPDNFKIKKAKLRGVESFGMLCAQTELQAGDDDDGLWELDLDAPVGEDLREYLSLDDKVIEVDLTPNRSDCLSIKGLAREVGVLNRIDVKYPEIKPVNHTIDDTFSVTVDASEACPRYLGRVIKNVNVKAESPQWLKEKLHRSDIRSIDPIVDVTNYVLLELGQPMHAFDLVKLSGGINVRMAKNEEPIQLLDGQDIKLNENTLVIADDSGAIAVAGVMGGETTAVSETTQDIFLESAFFTPLAIAGKARSYGLHTDSSHRFERGVDYDGAEAAIERATQLLLDIVGGEPGPVIKAENKDFLPQQSTVELLKERIAKKLGFGIPDDEVVEILTRLGMELKETSEEGWTFAIPSYRFDISIEADLFEELARIYGYNKLPTTKLHIPASLPRQSEMRIDIKTLASHMTSRGYQEVITYSFIDPSLHVLFDDADSVELLNPISADLSVMRTSLVPGLVKTLQSNLNRQQQRVRLFEKGLRFLGKDTQASSQVPSIAGLIYGERFESSWHSIKDTVDFYDIKGDIESLLAFCGKEVTYEPVKLPALHPGQTAQISLNSKAIGYVGALHPRITKKLDIPKSVYVFEIDSNAILGAEVPKYTNVSKFPEVTRDLALLLDKTIPVAKLENVIIDAAGDNLKNLKVFDVYSGEGIDPQRKSVAFNLTFQHSSRTLNEDEVNGPIEKIISRLEEEFDAKLR